MLEVVLVDRSFGDRYFCGECSLGKPQFTRVKGYATSYTDIEKAIEKRKELLEKGYVFIIESKNSSPTQKT